MTYRPLLLGLLLFGVVGCRPARTPREIVYGAQFTANGLDAYDAEDPMQKGFEKIGIPILVAGLVHEVIGIPLIVAGASDQWWSDEPRQEREPWPSAVRPEISARGVGVRY